MQYTKQEINPINIPSINKMEYLEAYYKELLLNSEYTIIRCQADYKNDIGMIKNGTHVFRVGIDQKVTDVVKGYTDNEPENIVRFFLEDKTLLSYSYDDMVLTFYDKKGWPLGIIGGVESIEEGIPSFYKLREELRLKEEARLIEVARLKEEARLKKEEKENELVN